MDGLSYALVIIGAVNWFLVGLFRYDAIVALFGGQDAILSRIVYSLIGLSGLWNLGRLFRQMQTKRMDEDIKRQEDVDD